MQGVGFTPGSAKRIIEAARYTLANRSILGDPALTGSGSSPAEAFTARCTSATADGNGNYPGVITRYDAPTAAWVDYGACKLRPPNGEAITSGTRYQAQPAGTTSGGDALYVVVVPGTSGGGSSSIPYGFGAKTGDILLTGSPANMGAPLTLPSAGYYLVTVQVGWYVSAIGGAGGDRIFGYLYDTTNSRPFLGTFVLFGRTFAAPEQGLSTVNFILQYTTAGTFPATIDFYAYHDGWLSGSNTTYITASGGGTEPGTTVTAVKLA